MTKRGVVISKLWKIHSLDSSRVNMDVKLDRSLLRTSLLYWDRIDIPDNTAISIQLPNDVLELKKEGIISREIVDCGYGSGGFISIGEGENLTFGNINLNGKELNFEQIFNDAPVEAFEKLRKKGDVFWSHAVEERVKIPFKREISRDRECVFPILNALPIPDEKTSFEEILKFKVTRQAELESFRVAVDSLYTHFSHMEDYDFICNGVKGNIEEAIRDLRRVSEEDLRSTKSKGLKFRFSLPNFISAASIMSSSIADPVQAVFGTLFAVTSVVGFDGRKEFPPKQAEPFRYALDVQERLSEKNKTSHF